MVASRELLESRETRDEDGGRVSTVRIFQVESSPELIRTGGVPIDPPLPGIGEKLPWDNSQTVFNRVAVRERGAVNTSRVMVYYSTDPPTWGGTNPADPFFKSWTLSYYRVAQPIPYAVEDPVSFRYIDGTGANQQIKTYPVAYVSHWESRSKFMRRCRVTNLTAAQWEPIQDLANRLCKIFGRWYLFTVSDLIETSRNTWDVTYTFEFDPGTPSGVFPATPNILFPDGLGTARPMPGLAEFWTRPPYHEVRLIPGAANGLPSWPQFVAVCPYEIVASGHLTLPGFGPL